MSGRSRVMILVVAAVLLVGLGVGYTLHAAHRSAARDKAQAGGAAGHPGTVRLDGRGQILFRTMAWGPARDHLASVPLGDPAGTRTTGGLSCLRFYAAGGTGVCLRADSGVMAAEEAVILDAQLRETRRFPLSGTPTRARVSPSGRMAAWTVFVSGDSYAGSAFSTRTSIFDTKTGKLYPNLEEFTVIRDGAPYRSADVNFWGVTFTADDNRFYATLSTKGRAYLIEGDVAARTVRTLRENVECPSLSPDGTRLVFKKRVPGVDPDIPWRLYVLDLKTMRETQLAETRTVDDQGAWQDDHTIMYKLPGDFGADIWTVPADGSGSPRLLIRSALSPVVVG